jgi:MFS family permease
MIAPDDGASRSDTHRTAPPLGPALAAMTGVQALVAIALFAPGVLAPKLGLEVSDISIYATAVFAVGMATSLYGGILAQRFGPCRVAAGCALAVCVGMLIATGATTPALLIAGLCVGLAFGPETPASSTLLGRLATPRQRPLIFSIRQTGNQIGAIVGSLTLPLVALSAPRAGYVGIAVIAVVAALFLVRLSRRYDADARTANAQPLALRAALQLVLASRALTTLALVSIPFSAMQLALNAYFVTFAVTVLQFEHVQAGIVLGVAQTGGLFGRLLWGWVATALATPRAVLAGLGLGMAAAFFVVAITGKSLPTPLLFAAAFFCGLTASGWNGVFLAEVARLAPADRLAEATGSVLTASYAGLLVSPLLVAAVASTGTLATSYAALATLALIATLGLIGSRHAET